MVKQVRWTALGEVRVLLDVMTSSCTRMAIIDKLRPAPAVVYQKGGKSPLRTTVDAERAFCAVFIEMTALIERSKHAPDAMWNLLLLVCKKSEETGAIFPSPKMSSLKKRSLRCKGSCRGTFSGMSGWRFTLSWEKLSKRPKRKERRRI